MKKPSILSMIVAPIATLCAEFVAAEPPGALEFAYHSARVGSPLPISSLPENVQAPEGELTLFADFSDVTGSPGRLYLVNRTSHRIAFSSQDGDPYVKLEAATEDGGWERAQTHHSSWCGNSYFVTPSLRPGEYFRFGAYFPSEGERRMVRYRLYQEHAFILDDATDEKDVYLHEHDLEKLPLNLVSNAGMGNVRPLDIDSARRDCFAIPLGSFKTVRDMATGVVDAPKECRSSAVATLGRFPTEQSLDLLRVFLSDADRSVSAAAMRGLAKMGLKLESAEQLYQELLQGGDAQLRMSATFALNERPVTPEVIRFVKGQLLDEDLYVRTVAMSVLASQCKKDPEIKAYINSIYDDPDPKIQSIFENTLLPTCISHRERGYKGKFREQRKQD